MIGRKLTLREFKNKANRIHNQFYNYKLVKYDNAHTKVKILCPEHGEFKQRPHRHLSGDGCPVCGRLKRRKSKTLTTEEFVSKANLIHNEKYDYSKVIYQNNKTLVLIICPIHGNFMQTPTNHLMKSGCPKCGMEKKVTKLTLNIETFLHKAKILHGFKYDYGKIIYKNTDIKIGIICLKHGEFWQKPYKHLQGHGCPVCSESKMEKEMRDFLNEHSFNFVSQYKINTQFIDFYLPDFKIAIECQGEQHFKPVDFSGKKVKDNIFTKVRELDAKKFNYCKENNIRLIYFSNKIEAITEKYLDIVFTDKIDILNTILSHERVL